MGIHSFTIGCSLGRHLGKLKLACPTPCFGAKQSGEHFFELFSVLTPALNEVAVERKLMWKLNGMDAPTSGIIGELRSARNRWRDE